jgi:hypothetical protein
MRTDGNYKMSGALKTRLALGKFKDKEQKNAWKRAMIQAELEASKKVATKSKDD